MRRPSVKVLAGSSSSTCLLTCCTGRVEEVTTIKRRREAEMVTWDIEREPILFIERCGLVDEIIMR